MARVRGGDKFSSAIREISKRLGKDATLQVGFLEGATEADGTSVALVALVNEYGAPSRGQPPRPFFRNMIAKNEKTWPQELITILRNNNYDIEKSLELMGVRMADQVKESILELWSPSLAPATIARKGFDKPLIESSTMLNSVGHKVKIGKGK